MSALEAFLLWRRFERQQWLSPESLREVQDKRLRSMLQWAYNRVPYYRGLFRSLNLHPSAVRTARDLAKLPVLTKHDVRRNAQDLRARGMRMRHAATTGSTGCPLTISHDAESSAAGKAVMLRALRAHGVRFADKFVRITHRPHRQALHERLGVLPIRSLSVYDAPAGLAQAARALKPDVLHTYPSVLQAMISSGARLPRVRRVFSTTEMLTERAREQIRQAFDAPVADLHGAVEFPSLLWECPSGAGYHVDTDYAVVEHGDNNELIVTGLFNKGMPLIRYALGDLAEPDDERCPCGRSLPLVKRIEGRADDALVMPNGELVSPRRVNVLDGIEGVEQYRIVQRRNDRIVAEVVPSGRWTPALAEDVVARISRGIHGYDVEVSAKPVSAIPRGPGGKMKTVVSYVGA